MNTYFRLFSTHEQYESWFDDTVEHGANTVSFDRSHTHFNKLYDEMYFTVKALENGTISFSNNGLSYSKNQGKTWQTLAANTTLSVNEGNAVLFKGTITPQNNVGIGTFSFSNEVNVYGNAMSLLFGDDFIGQKNLTGKNYGLMKLFNGAVKLKEAKSLSLPATTLSSVCYREMFCGCTSLTSTPELPATTLTWSCYCLMFCGCTNITTVPDLPVSTMGSGSCEKMFSGCTSLIAAPELPATALAITCCSSMFANCVNMTTAPSILPATTLAASCYQNMFTGCRSLTTVPELPATTLADRCYGSMFSSCSGLTTTPELPATTLATYCYSNMFYNCTSLTSAPELPATELTQNCYAAMFSGCTNLNYIKAMFTTEPSTAYTNNWVAGVAQTGTFVKNGNAEWELIGPHGIPSGWTVEEEIVDVDNFIYIDDFDAFDTTAYDLVDDPEMRGCNYFILNGTTTYNGNTYYLWEEDINSSGDYVLTTTTDFTGLSLADDISNRYCPFAYYMTQDMMYSSQDHPDYILIAYEVDGNDKHIWIDDLNNEKEKEMSIADPISYGSNEYKLLDEKFTYNNIEYYLWEFTTNNLSTFDSGKYILTTKTKFNGETLEDDIYADVCPFEYILNSDKELYATSEDYPNYVIVKQVFVERQEDLDRWIWIDDFPQEVADNEFDGDMEAFKQYYIDDVEQTNCFKLSGTTTYDGDTYYLWVSDNESSEGYCALTNEIDFANLSLEDNIDNDYAPLAYFATTDLESMVYSGNDVSGYILVKYETAPKS